MNQIKRYTTVALLSLAVTGAWIALPFFPISSAQATVATPSQLARTWMPAFNVDQSIYLDSKIRNHPTAPFQFSADFSKKLSILGKLADLKYLVVAAQQGAEPIPSGTKLGIAKIDELLPSWSSVNGFPLQNYVLIFWVRRSDNPTKGSVAVNVGSEVRDWGVTPESLSAPEGLVIPELKRFMPQDPEGALLAIAQNINDTVLTTRQAQLRLQTVPSSMDSLSHSLETLLDPLLLVLAAGSASYILIMLVRARTAKKHKAETLMNRWKVVTANGAALYTELMENYFSKLEYISSLKVDGTFSTQVEQARRSLSNFICHWTEAEKRTSQAALAFEQKKYGQVVQLLKHEPIKVTGEALPFKVTTLLSGLTPTQEYTPEKLLSSMSHLYDAARDKTLELIEDYEGAAQFQTGQPQKIAEAVARVKQILETPFKYDLAIASAPTELPQKTYFDPAQTAEFFAKIAELIQLGSEAWSRNDLNETIRLYTLINQLLTEREAQALNVISEKVSCDNLSVEVDEAIDVTYRHIQSKEELAKASLEKVKTTFPGEDISIHLKKLDEVRDLFFWTKTQFQEVQRLYLATQFDRAFKMLMSVMDALIEQRTPLNDLIELPQTLAKQQQVLREQISRHKSYPSRFGAVAQGSDLDALENMLFLGQLSQVQNQLALIEVTQSSAEALQSSSNYVSYSDSGSSYDSSSSSDSSYSSYDSGSSSSSYDSSSSDSSYDSSSFGSDYGSSSGGGDY